MKNIFTQVSRDEVQKILKKNPVWISRVSIIVSLFVTAIICFISFYIKYPVIVNARATVISVTDNRTFKCSILTDANKTESIKPGQDTKLIFDRYSINEYGFLKGKIEMVSSAPASDSGSIVEIYGTNSFTTNKGKYINLKNGMEGNIEITTDEVPLINKLLKSVKIIPLVFFIKLSL